VGKPPFGARSLLPANALWFWLLNAVPLAIAAAVAASLAWMAFDREPPWIRIEGALDPPAERGHEVQAHFIAVLPQPERTEPRYCPGRVQREILDDWGLEPLDAAARHDLLEILEERYGRRSTIITSPGDFIGIRTKWG
jgi:hypothetical protein